MKKEKAIAGIYAAENVSPGLSHHNLVSEVVAEFQRNQTDVQCANKQKCGVGFQTELKKVEEKLMDFT